MDSTTVLLVALAALAAIVTGIDPPQPQYRNLFLHVIDKCKECVGATDDEVEIALNGGNLTTPTLKCLQYCMYHETTIFDGVVLNEELARGFYMVLYGPNITLGAILIDSCYNEAKDKSETDACGFSANFQECFIISENEDKFTRN